MRIKYPNLVRMLAVLAIVCSLVAIVAAPAYAAAGITLSTPAGPVGTPVTITASGFTASSYLTATFDGAALTTVPPSVQAGTSGNATFAITIPAAVTGDHEIKVTDGAFSSTATFAVQPKVKISPTSGPVATVVTITGTGFNAGVGGFVYIEEIGTGNLTLATVPLIDSNGGFTVSGTIPPLTSGAHTVWGADNAGNFTWNLPAYANNATFTVTPGIAISPTSGLAGTTANLSGSGWAAGNVTITFAGGSPTTVVAAANGQIAAAYQIPPAAALGITQIVATQGANTATTTFTVVARALTLTPSSGPRGTDVLVTGSNMSTGPGHTIAVGQLTFGGTAWNTAAAITIDTTGVISPTTLTVQPAFLLGANTVQARDDMGLVATATFTVTKPTIAINPTTGPKGSTVVVTGSGWVPGDLVTIKLNGTAAQTVSPDGTGAIAATITIPTTAVPGAHTVTADDANLNASSAVTFTVPGAAISVTPGTGVATTTVALSGSGFRAYFPITLTIGGYQLTQQALTDALGAFTYTFNVPGLQPGVQVILATDLTNTATTFFEITATPVSVVNQLAGISTQLVRVWGYFGGQWQLYDPADPAGSDLATLTAGRGYWINVSANCQLVYQAYSYTLTAGWNLVGWR